MTFLVDPRANAQGVAHFMDIIEDFEGPIDVDQIGELLTHKSNLASLTEEHKGNHQKWVLGTIVEPMSAGYGFANAHFSA